MPRSPIEHLISPRVERASASLGEHIRAARLAREMTQAELAQRSGMGLATLKRLEAGHAGIAVGYVLACLEILGLMQPLVASIAPGADAEGQARRALVTTRATKSKKASDEYDF